MFYALLSVENIWAKTASIHCGETVKEMMSGVLERCNEVIDNFLEYKSREEVLVEEGRYNDDYFYFLTGESFTIEEAKGFYFEISDITFFMRCVVTSFEDLVKEYAKFSESNFVYAEWEMLPGLEGTKEQIRGIKEDLFIIGASYTDMDDDVAEKWRSEIKYLIRKPEYDL